MHRRTIRLLSPGGPRAGGAPCRRLGGLAAQGRSVLAGVPPLAVAIAAIAVPAVGSTVPIGLFGRESLGPGLGGLRRGGPPLGARAGRLSRLSRRSSTELLLRRAAPASAECARQLPAGASSASG